MFCCFKNYGVTFIHFALALWVVVFVVQTTAQSHTETYVTYDTATRQVRSCDVRTRRELQNITACDDCGPIVRPICVYNLETVIVSRTATRCQSGWIPYPDCNDFDECSQDVAGCGQNCNNNFGSYTCSCNAGYRLASDGRKCNDIDECQERTSNCTQACFNTVSSYTCSCYAGYRLTSNGLSCNDIDECSEGSSGCARTCSNTNGSYTCSCSVGFRLASDERLCNDIDECQEGTSGCAKYCSNTLGSFTCTCDVGYRLASDGMSCNDIDECSEGTAACAQNCSNTVGSYLCSCNSGYRLASNGSSCNDIDECTAQLHDCKMVEHLICENTIGGYGCVCETGFQQVGPRTCQDINECETFTDNCTQYENLTCENIIGGYKCEQPEAGSNSMSEATITKIIVIVVCIVVGVALIIIAVACGIICARKRKRNEVDRKKSNAELTAANGSDNATMSTNSASSKSVVEATEYENVTPTSRKSKGKKNIKNEKVASDSTYQGLTSVTQMKNVYEAIRLPAESIDISDQRDHSNDYSNT